MTTPFLTAAEAAARLRISRATLYAYVSRGRLTAERDTKDPRKRLYAAADVDRLAAARAAGRSAAAVAAGAIQFGAPVLVSALTTIDSGRLYYRGRDATALARTATLEDAAALLWQTPFAPATAPAPNASAPMRARLFALLAARAASDPPSRHRHRESLAAEGAELMAACAAAVSGTASRRHAHESLALGWRRPQARETLRTALVLLADHELNASTFACRVAASTGASLAASALAGLSALTGPLHGGYAERVIAFVNTATRRGDLRAAVLERVARKAQPLGFGHVLYPAGDPRAEAILAGIGLPEAYAQLRRITFKETGQRPNVDFALAAMTQALRLPDDAPFAIFALARLTGWIAHAIEQSESNALIRPRARYSGPPPEPVRRPPR